MKKREWKDLTLLTEYLKLETQLQKLIKQRHCIIIKEHESVVSIVLCVNKNRLHEIITIHISHLQGKYLDNYAYFYIASFQFLGTHKYVSVILLFAVCVCRQQSANEI